MMRRGVRGERGAVVIQTAVSLVVMFGFSAFVIDYGMLWLSREQAQLAADSGAMAGAIAQAYDGADAVVHSARGIVSANPVWFSTASTEVLPGPCPADAAGAECVRVNVYRDGTNSSTRLPTFFGAVLGITSQGVRATATAQVASGTGTPCMKPLAIPDRWTEHAPVDKPWEAGDVFRKWDEVGPGRGSLAAHPRDEYAAPAPGDVGTGLTLPVDLGAEFTLTFSYAWAGDPITQGMMLPLELPGNYHDNISHACHGQFTAIGSYMATDASADYSDTTHAFDELVEADPGATWDSANNRIQGSCAPGCASISPRLIALGVFDVDEYQFMRANSSWCPTGPCVKVANIIGFFVDRVTAMGAVGYLTKYPGLMTAGTPALLPDSSFLPAVTLVR